jgi:dihydroxyacetone kinase-like protein
MPFDESGQLSYDDFVAWIRRFAALVSENKSYLTDLDAAIGDADHGINMDRGFQAVLGKLDAQAPGDIGALLKTVSAALMSNVGGASGIFYYGFFAKLGATTAGKSTLSLPEFLAGMDAGVEDIQRRGKAEPGDKTMLDALLPARAALKRALESGETPSAALSAAVEAADRGMEATIPLVARKGRASYLGERSAGHQDPGATSVDLLIHAARDEWAG